MASEKSKSDGFSNPEKKNRFKEFFKELLKILLPKSTSKAKNDNKKQNTTDALRAEPAVSQQHPFSSMTPGQLSVSLKAHNAKIQILQQQMTQQREKMKKIFSLQRAFIAKGSRRYQEEMNKLKEMATKTSEQLKNQQKSMLGLIESRNMLLQNAKERGLTMQQPEPPQKAQKTASDMPFSQRQASKRQRNENSVERDTSAQTPSRLMQRSHKALGGRDLG